MNEMKNSTVLERIFAHARTMDQKGNPAMTAERFLVAVVDIINDDTNDNFEINELRRIVKEYNIDLAETRRNLFEYITVNDNVGFLEGIYLQKKIYEAKSKAEQQGEIELSAARLLMCILADPSEQIEKLLATAEGQTAQTP